MTVHCIYEVIVRNELTGDTAGVALSATCGQEAQVEALHYLFHNRRWNRAVALPATVANENSPDRLHGRGCLLQLPTDAEQAPSGRSGELITQLDASAEALGTGLAARPSAGSLPI